MMFERRPTITISWIVIVVLFPSCLSMYVRVLLTFLRASPKDYNRVIVIAHALAQLRADHLVLVGVSVFIEVQASSAFCLLLSARLTAR